MSLYYASLNNNLSERLFSWEEGGYALEILGANKLAD